MRALSTKQPLSRLAPILLLLALAALLPAGTAFAQINVNVSLAGNFSYTAPFHGGTFTCNASGGGSYPAGATPVITLNSPTTNNGAANVVMFNVASATVNGAAVAFAAGPPATYTMPALVAPGPYDVVITVQQAGWFIWAISGGNGTISPPVPGTAATNPVLVANGANQAFTFAPGEFYQVLSVFVDGAFLPNVQGQLLNAAGNNFHRITTYTFSDVTANHSIEVFFEPLYTIYCGNAGPAQPQFGSNPFEPNALVGRYSSAGDIAATAIAGTGTNTAGPAWNFINSQGYYYGDQFNFVESNAYLDYKFGEDCPRNGGSPDSALQTINPTTITIPTANNTTLAEANSTDGTSKTTSLQTSVYWVMSGITGEIIATNAGTADVNGAYHFSGMLNGANTYTNFLGTYAISFDGTSTWSLVHNADVKTYYTTSGTAKTFPMGVWSTTVNGTAPPPTFVSTLSTADLGKNGVEQTLPVTIYSDTTVVGWWVRAARMAWLIEPGPPPQLSCSPAGCPTLFTGLDTDSHTPALGIAYNSISGLYHGAAVQLVFEDTLTDTGTFNGNVTFQGYSGNVPPGSQSSASSPVSTSCAFDNLGYPAGLCGGAGSNITINFPFQTGFPGALLYTPQPLGSYPPTAMPINRDPHDTQGVVQFGLMQINLMSPNYLLQTQYIPVRRTDAFGIGVPANPAQSAGSETTIPSDTAWPPDTEAIPACDSSLFTMAGAAAAHYAWGYNYFGQVGMGLIGPWNYDPSNPAIPPNADPNFTGLPFNAYYGPLAPPAVYAGGIAPVNDASIQDTGAANTSFSSGVPSTYGPFGLPGDYTAQWPHWYQQIGFTHHFTGWEAANDEFGLNSEFDNWNNRKFFYPDDNFEFGRDIFQPMESLHQQDGYSWHSFQKCASEVSTGRMHSLALRDDGVISAWGDNEYGQLGLGAGTSLITNPGPYSAANPAIPPASGYITPNETVAFADPQELTGGGTALSTLGGAPAPPYPYNLSTGQPPLPQDTSGLAAGFDHSIAVLSNGVVAVWGRNNWGQLGQGTQDDVSGGHPAPMPVPDSTDPSGKVENVAAVAAGDYFSLVLKRDGSVWGWGLNLDGQLGNGTQLNQFSPVQIGVSGNTGTPGPIVDPRSPTPSTSPVFLMTKFVGHTQQLTWATMSPDGSAVATASYDGSVKIWNPVAAAGSAPIRTMCDATDAGTNAHTGPIDSAAYSPDGTLIVTASADRSAKLWNAATGAYVLSLVDPSLYGGSNITDAHMGSVTSASFSADGTLIVTSGVDLVAKVWNSASGALVSTTTTSNAIAAVAPYSQSAHGHGRGLDAAVFSPNTNTVIYTASSDQKVKAWSVTTATATWLNDFVDSTNAGVAPNSHTNAVTSIAAVAKDATDDYVVSGSMDCTGKVWTVAVGASAATPALTYTLDSLFDGNVGNGMTLMGHIGGVLGVAVAEDASSGTFYAATCSTDTTVKRWPLTGAAGVLVPDHSYYRHADWINHVEFARTGAGKVSGNLLLTAAGSTQFTIPDYTAKLGQTPVVVSIDGGTSHCLAVLEDGTVWSWGYNLYGELGQGAGVAENVLTPAQVLNADGTAFNVGNTDPSAGGTWGASAGNDHSVAIKNNGTIWSWGRNNYGQLAIGTMDDQSGGHPSPVQALTAAATNLTNMQAVSAGWGYTIARGFGVSTTSISGAGSAAVNGLYVSSGGQYVLENSGGTTVISGSNLEIGGTTYYVDGPNWNLSVVVAGAGTAAANGTYLVTGSNNQFGAGPTNTYALQGSYGGTTITYDGAGTWNLSTTTALGPSLLYHATSGPSVPPPANGWSNSTVVHTVYNGASPAPTLTINGVGLYPLPTQFSGTNYMYGWGHNNHGQLGIDGPGAPAPANSDQAYATLLPLASSAVMFSGPWAGNCPQTSLKARYWHSQVAGFWAFHTINWHADPVTGGVIIPYAFPYNTTNAPQTGLPGQTIYDFYSSNSPTTGSNGVANCIGAVSAESGTTIQLYAIPRPGYTFDHWDGYAPSQKQLTSWTYNNFDPAAGSQKTMDVTAHFDAVPLTYNLVINTHLWVNGADGGAITGAIVTGGGTYDQNAVATLTATNDAQYQFDHWGGDPQIANSKLDPAYLLMNGQMVVAGTETVTAYFTAQAYTVTVSVNPPAAATATYSVPAGTAGPPYPYNTQVTLDAPANGGWIFNGWTVKLANGTSVAVTSNNVAGDPSNSYFFLTGNTTAVANFVQAYTIVVNVPQGGAAGSLTGAPALTGISPNYITTVQTGGTGLTLTATPAPLYNFSSWTVPPGLTYTTSGANGSVLNATYAAIAAYAISAGTATVNIQANFTPINPLTLTLATYLTNDPAPRSPDSAGGAVAANALGPYVSGASITLTATPTNGSYVVAYWLSSADTPPYSVQHNPGSLQYTFTITANTTVQVYFTHTPVTLTTVMHLDTFDVDVSDAGTVTGAGSYAAGTVEPITVAANANFLCIGFTATSTNPNVTPVFTPAGVNPGTTSGSVTLADSTTLVVHFVCPAVCAVKPADTITVVPPKNTALSTRVGEVIGGATGMITAQLNYWYPTFGTATTLLPNGSALLGTLIGTVGNPTNSPITLDFKQPGTTYNATGQIVYPGTPGAYLGPSGPQKQAPGPGGGATFANLTVDRVGSLYQFSCMYPVTYTPAGGALTTVYASGDSPPFDIWADAGYVMAAGYNQFGQLGRVASSANTLDDLSAPLWKRAGSAQFFANSSSAYAGSLGTPWPHFNTFDVNGANGRPGWTWPAADDKASSAQQWLDRTWSYSWDDFTQGSDHYDWEAVDGNVAAGGPFTGGPPVNQHGNPATGAAGIVVQAVAAGQYHSLGLVSYGAIKVWGRNNFGQLGDGTLTDQYEPTEIGLPAGPATAIAAGYNHSLALANNGTVWAWGSNAQGQLGLGNGAPLEETPQEVTDPTDPTGFLHNVIAISAGDYFSVALKQDGTVWAWGYNADGELGNNSTVQSSVPVQVNASLAGIPSQFSVLSLNGKPALNQGGTTYTSVVTSVDYVTFGGVSYAAAGYTAYTDPNGNALATDQNLAMLYNAQSGSLLATFNDSANNGANAHAGGSTVEAVKFLQTGDGNLYLLTGGSDRRAKVWLAAQPGASAPAVIGTYVRDLGDPATVQATITSIVANPGGGYTVGVSSGSAFPNGSMVLASDPAGDLISGQVASGGDTTALVLSYATTAGNPLNLIGQTLSLFPAPTPFADLGAVTSMDVYATGTLTYTAGAPQLVVTGSVDHSAKIWDAVSLGISATYPVGQISNKPLLALAGASGHTEAVDAVHFSPNGTKVATGSADLSAKVWTVVNAGKVVAQAALANPVTLTGHTGPVNAVAYGRTGGAANPTNWIVTGSADQSIKVWTEIGANYATYTPFLTGNPDGHKDTVTSVAMSSDGLTIMSGSRDQTIKRWTFDPLTVAKCVLDHGILDSLYTQRSDATLQRHSAGVNAIVLEGGNPNWVVSGSADSTAKIGQTPAVVAIDAGAFHTVALTSDGQVWGWGLNTEGQLGNGTTASSGLPVPVQFLNAGVPLAGLQAMQAIAAGDAHSLAVSLTGANLYAWGDDTYGQLGDGKPIPAPAWRTRPDLTLPVIQKANGTPLTGIQTISAGWGYCLARLTTGQVWAWGNNNHGQLGDDKGAFSDGFPPNGGWPNTYVPTYQETAGAILVTSQYTNYANSPGPGTTSATNFWDTLSFSGDTTTLIANAESADYSASTAWQPNVPNQSISAGYWHSLGVVPTTPYRTILTWTVNPPGAGMVQLAATQAVRGASSQVVFAVTPGSADSSEGTITADMGSDITYTATPARGYVFDHWSEYTPPGDPTQASQTWPVDFYDHQTVANFTVSPLEWTLTTAASPVAGGTITGGGTYNDETAVPISAKPNSGYVFSHWTGAPDIEGSTNPNETVRVTSNVTVTGVFVASYTLTLTASGLAPGVTPTLLGAGSYAQNTTVNIKASAPGYQFTSWTIVSGVGPVVSNGNPADPSDSHIVLVANTTLQANFTALWTLTVASTPVTGAVISGTSPGTTNYVVQNILDGTAISLTAAPTVVSGVATYNFQNWTGAGGSALPASWTAAGSNVSGTIQANTTLQANYTIQTWTLSVNSSPVAGAGITGTNPGTTNYAVTVNDGASISLSAPATLVSAGANYSFVNWAAPAGWTATGLSVPGTIHANTTLQANYAVGTWSLTVNSLPVTGAAITGTYPGTTDYTALNVADNTAIALTAPATLVSGATLYNFTSWTAPAGWTVAGAVVSGNIRANTVLQANYAVQIWTLSVNSSPVPGAGVTGTYPGTTNYSVSSVNDGLAVSLTAAPTCASGAITYVFASWTGPSGAALPAGWTAAGATVSGAIHANTTLLANYSPALTVQSNGIGQVPITGSPLNAAGITNYVALVGLNAAVTLTAPSPFTSGGKTYNFAYWTLNGPGVTSPPAGQASVTFTITGATTAIATYSNQGVLGVASIPPDVVITGTPVPGTTPYTVNVTFGASVSLTAPRHAVAGNTTFHFEYWTVNAVPQAAGQLNLTFLMTGNTVAVAVYTSSDVKPPQVTGTDPAANAIQVPTDSLVQLQIKDPRSGVCLGGESAGGATQIQPVTITINGDTIYNGANETSPGEYNTVSLPQAVQGICYRTGTPADYTFTFQPAVEFPEGETVTVVVNASDKADNVMPTDSYSFDALMRTFGANFKVNSDVGTLSHSAPATTWSSAGSTAGQIWVAWDQAMQPVNGNTNIYVAERPAPTPLAIPPVLTPSFGTSVAVQPSAFNQLAPAIVYDGFSGRLYAVWQDDSTVTWSIRGASSADGGNTWTPFTVATVPGFNETAPAIAVDALGNLYAAWQDDSSGYQQIWAAVSSDGGMAWTAMQVTTDASNHTNPAMTVDSTGVAYVVWTDGRNVAAGNGTNIYGAESAAVGAIPAWTPVPLVTGAGNQSYPSVAAEFGGDILHLVWVNATAGQQGNVYHGVTTGGLTGAPLIGTNIVDDTSGALHTVPKVAVTGTGAAANVFVCWQDSRNVVAPNNNTDIYYAESLAGAPFGTNILVNDDKTSIAPHTLPCIGVGLESEPYMAWVDGRQGPAEIWGADALVTLVANSENVGSAGGIVNATGGTETTPVTPSDVILSIPRNAIPAGVTLTVSIAQVANPPAPPPDAFGLVYDFSPSEAVFSHPVTVTIPLLPGEDVKYKSYTVYWYNFLTGAWSKSGITGVRHLVISSTLHAMTFKTTHFTIFATAGVGKELH